MKPGKNGDFKFIYITAGLCSSFSGLGLLCAIRRFARGEKSEVKVGTLKLLCVFKALLTLVHHNVSLKLDICSFVTGSIPR